MVLPILSLFGLLGSLFHSKLREGRKGRFKALRQLKDFSDTLNGNETVYWFHAASFGEFEQVRPVLAGLKEIEPHSLAIVSFFSPSGYKHVTDNHIDCKVYLPFDFPWTIKKALNIVKPKKLILAAYDIWPNLIWMAKTMGIHSTLFAARFSEGTTKLAPFVRNFYRNVYGCLSAIYTISNEDHHRLEKILHPAGNPVVRVLGNPRYDQVKTSADKITKTRTESVLLREKRLIVGSCHVEDEQIILDPILRLLNDIPELSLIWVPHEPTDRVVLKAESQFTEKGFTVTRLGNKSPDELTGSRIIVVDSVGKLSTLYWEGQIAYVGGGFSSGVHNVMEPAIARLPVLFGPRYKSFLEAEELIENGGGFSIESGSELYYNLKNLLTNREFFLKASFAATHVIHKNLGSSTRVVRNLIHD